MADLNSTINHISNVFSRANPAINSITYALLILFMGFIIGRIIGKILHRILHALEIDKNIEKKAKFGFSLETLISSVTTYIIYIITVILSLSVFGLSNTVVYIIVFVAIVVGAIFLLLTFKDFITNFVGRKAVKKKYKIKEGTQIKIKNVEGNVVKTGTFEMHLKTKKGEDIFVPNALFWKEKVQKIRKKKKVSGKKTGKKVIKKK